MSLTGQLDVFSLEEILRLVSRSSRSGCLRIGSPDLHGYVYFEEGRVALAMVGTEEELHVTESSQNHPGNDFQDEVVESLYQIRQQKGGEFVFSVDAVPRYRSTTSFDVELCISDMELRASEWADIESVIPSIDTALRVNPEAPDGEPVTLDPNTWRLVAGFAGESTVRTLADRLALPRFRVGKDLTALVRSGLVDVATEAGLFTLSHESTLPPQGGDHSPATPEPAAVQPDSYNQGWWTEPVEPAVANPVAEIPIDPAATEGSSDPFLDRVFSQLEETPEGQGSLDGTAAGFLRRRRVSSVGLDE